MPDGLCRTQPGGAARALWRTFEVSKPEADGQLSPLPDAFGFLHELIVHNGGIADIVLRPKAGVDRPALPELAWPEPAVAMARPAAAMPDGRLPGLAWSEPAVARRMG